MGKTPSDYKTNKSDFNIDALMSFVEIMYRLPSLVKLMKVLHDAIADGDLKEVTSNELEMTHKSYLFILVK